MNKLYNTSIKKIGEDYYLNYYERECPVLESYVSEVMYSDAVNQWSKSKLSILIHPTQLETFLSLSFIGRYVTESELRAGVPVPSEKIIIKNVSDKGYDKNGDLIFTDYAFTTIPTKEDLKRMENYQKMLSISSLPISKDEEKAKVFNVECKDGCTYSRAIGQTFPRKCVNCHKSESAAPLEDKLISQEWISVEDKLPEKEDSYIVFGHKTHWVLWFNTSGHFKGDFTDTDNNGYDFKCYGITHWMPLPEPPKITKL